MTARVPNRNAVSYIRNLQDFHNSYGSFRGSWQNDYLPDSGRLWGEDLSSFKKLTQQDEKWYIVWSYATPIAAYSPRMGMWWTAGQKYSRSTSKHQTFVNMAVK
jgi:hypothetical protein